MNCQIFKSLRKPDTYVYLPSGAEFEALPEALRRVFGSPEKVMDLDLNSDTKLALADVSDVLKKIAEHGFYLQLPPNAQLSKHDPWA